MPKKRKSLGDFKVGVYVLHTTLIGGYQRVRSYHKVVRVDVERSVITLKHLYDGSEHEVSYPVPCPILEISCSMIKIRKGCVPNFSGS